MNVRLLAARTARVVAATVLVGGISAPAAFAEGPGYGGNADTLTVSWVPADEAVEPAEAPTDTPADTPAPEAPPVDPGTGDSPIDDAAAAAPAVLLGSGLRTAGFRVQSEGQPTLAPDALELQVNGLGFRAKSEVVVRIGDSAPVASRSDTAGSLSVAIDPALIGGTEPGLTVVAVGRGPSGTAVTLYGSVPPEPSGLGPMTLVPWFALAVALVGGGLWLRNRRRDPAESSTTDPTDAAPAV